MTRYLIETIEISWVLVESSLGESTSHAVVLHYTEDAAMKRQLGSVVLNPGHIPVRIVLARIDEEQYRRA